MPRRASEGSICTLILQRPFWMVPSDRRKPQVKALPSWDSQEYFSFFPWPPSIFFWNFLIVRMSPKRKPKSLKIYKIIIVDDNGILPYLLFPQNDSLYSGNPVVYTITWMFIWYQNSLSLLPHNSCPVAWFNKWDLLNYAYMYTPGTVERHFLRFSFRRKDFKTFCFR